MNDTVKTLPNAPVRQRGGVVPLSDYRSPWLGFRARLMGMIEAVMIPGQHPDPMQAALLIRLDDHAPTEHRRDHPPSRTVL